jgi:hypothetical protein
MLLFCISGGRPSFVTHTPDLQVSPAEQSLFVTHCGVGAPLLFAKLPPSTSLMDLASSLAAAQAATMRGIAANPVIRSRNLIRRMMSSLRFERTCKASTGPLL